MPQSISFTVTDFVCPAKEIFFSLTSEEMCVVHLVHLEMFFSRDAMNVCVFYYMETSELWDSGDVICTCVG